MMPAGRQVCSMPMSAQGHQQIRVAPSGLQEIPKQLHNTNDCSQRAQGFFQRFWLIQENADAELTWFCRIRLIAGPDELEWEGVVQRITHSVRKSDQGPNLKAGKKFHLPSSVCVRYIRFARAEQRNSTIESNVGWKWEKQINQYLYATKNYERAFHHHKLPPFLMSLVQEVKSIIGFLHPPGKYSASTQPNTPAYEPKNCKVKV